MEVRDMSSMRKEFITSHLRLQLNRLRGVLSNMEEERACNCNYAHESLKEIENSLRKIRKLYANN
ncbi:MAG: hypothetical protein WC469_01640 [Candidatus Omnitrophota bacterium]|jgi:hypothetical protein